MEGLFLLSFLGCFYMHNLITVLKIVKPNGNKKSVQCLDSQAFSKPGSASPGPSLVKYVALIQSRSINIWIVLVYSKTKKKNNECLIRKIWEKILWATNRVYAGVGNMRSMVWVWPMELLDLACGARVGSEVFWQWRALLALGLSSWVVSRPSSWELCSCCSRGQAEVVARKSPVGRVQHQPTSDQSLVVLAYNAKSCWAVNSRGPQNSIILWASLRRGGISIAPGENLQSTCPTVVLLTVIYRFSLCYPGLTMPLKSG